MSDIEENHEEDAPPSRVPVLPTLITLGSLFCGFGAIIVATMTRPSGTALGAMAQAGTEVSDTLGFLYARQLGRLELASWLVIAAMIFDALDGRIARLAKQTSDFGAQLDSLCDAISFGVAPAALAMSVMSEFYQGWQARLVWVACVLYVTCAVLRLARFNVHTTHDESSHRSFTGLPTPPAAGMIASFVIMHVNLVEHYEFVWVGRIVLPVLLLVVGPLMVSRIRYTHLVHELTKGQRSFPFFIGLIFFMFLVVILREYILPVVFTAYLLSGVVGLALGRLLDRIDVAENHDSFFR